MNIRDSLHGSIPISEEEKSVIDHPLFQRLRGIKQLGFLHWIFPGATHTRFEHSLGILFVAKKIILAIQKNRPFVEKYVLLFEKNTGKNIAKLLFNSMDALEDPKVLLRLHLACLLHDIGHGPFSHTSEFLTKSLSWDNIIEDWKVYQETWLEKSFLKMKEAAVKPRHEIFSCLLIREIFRDVFPNDANLLQDVLSIINLGIPPTPSGILEKNCLRLLFSDILSGEIDADRIDYLLRDSAATGAKYGVFDLERLLENICCFVDQQDQVRIAMRSYGLLAFEHFLFSRYQMYLQVYMNRTNQSMENALEFMCNKMYENGVRADMFFPKNKEQFIHFIDQNLESILLQTIQKVVKEKEKVLELETLCNEIFFQRKTWTTVYEKISIGTDPKYLIILEKLKSNPVLAPYVVAKEYIKNLFDSDLYSHEIPIFLHEEPLSDKVIWTKQDLSCMYQKMNGKVFLRRIIIHPQYWEAALQTISA